MSLFLHSKYMIIISIGVDRRFSRQRCPRCSTRAKHWVTWQRAWLVLRSWFLRKPVGKIFSSKKYYCTDVSQWTLLSFYWTRMTDHLSLLFCHILPLALFIIHVLRVIATFPTFWKAAHGSFRSHNAPQFTLSGRFHRDAAAAVNFSWNDLWMQRFYKSRNKVTVLKCSTHDVFVFGCLVCAAGTFLVFVQQWF